MTFWQNKLLNWRNFWIDTWYELQNGSYEIDYKRFPHHIDLTYAGTSTKKVGIFTFLAAWPGWAEPVIMISGFPDWPGLGRAREILISEGGGFYSKQAIPSLPEWIPGKSSFRKGGILIWGGFLFEIPLIPDTIPVLITEFLSDTKELARVISGNINVWFL